MNNTRFATIIHILTLLGKQPNSWLSSELISNSIKINAVIVRKELILLQDKGWVMSKKGKEGGFTLKISPKDISLADIFLLVNQVNILGKKNQCCKGDCSVGKTINTQLDKLFRDTDQLVVESLKNKTLDDFINYFE